MDFLERLDGLLKARGITAKDLTEKLGVGRTTVNDWKRGKSTPSPKILVGLSQIFGVSIDWLLTGSEEQNNSNFLPPEEHQLLEFFRKLPENEKHRTLGNVEGKVEVYANNVEERKLPIGATHLSREVPENDIEDVEVVDMVVYDQKAAAGFGNYLDEHSDYEEISVKASDVPHGADFGIRIDGDSMEPIIKDGSIVWVKESIKIENGQVGIFILDNAAYCKKLHIDYDRRTAYLESANNEYAPIELNEHSNLRTVGRVLGH